MMTTAPSECVDVKVSMICLEVLDRDDLVVVGGTVEVVRVVSGSEEEPGGVGVALWLVVVVLGGGGGALLVLDEVMVLLLVVLTAVDDEELSGGEVADVVVSVVGVGLTLTVVELVSRFASCRVEVARCSSAWRAASMAWRSARNLPGRYRWRRSWRDEGEVDVPSAG